eukprot:TRINITY_DN9642_c0_g1_i7.p1 TRINITY_DN9642_c0_g1~~TRINITY_DN9642_c0_g1_i7.p1  ORF type:complete len:346 (-),score=55.31 TRINITY_DN9642_c0_g1_i7:48-1085(-)
MLSLFMSRVVCRSHPSCHKIFVGHTKDVLSVTVKGSIQHRWYETQTMSPDACNSVPGIPTLIPESWDGNFANIPIEFDENGKRIFALLQRPQGKRWWWVITEDEKDVRINKYQLTFQWPLIDSFEGISLSEFRALFLKVRQIFEKITIQFPNPEFLWKILYSKYSGSVMGYHLAKEIFGSFSELESQQQPEPPVEFIYACHRYLFTSLEYFEPSSGRIGFICRNPEDVASYVEACNREYRREEARKLFLEKLRYVLNKHQPDPHYEGGKFSTGEGFSKIPKEFFKKGKELPTDLTLSRAPLVEDNDEIFDSEYDLEFFSQIKEFAFNDSPHLVKKRKNTWHVFVN